MKIKLLIILALIPLFGMSQTNKGNSYVEVKTGLSLSEVAKNSKPILGYNLNVSYSYSLIENMDLMVSLSTSDAYSTEDTPTFVQPMYFCNALQLGVRGKVRCLDIVNLKLSLSGGMMAYAYNDILDYSNDFMTEMILTSCFSGMAEIDFNISKNVALGVFYGKSIAYRYYAPNPHFDTAGLSLSFKI